MKRKIYAISLLLSFLVVLSHELIDHHHHDSKAIDLSVIHKHHEADGHQHSKKHYQHHDTTDDENEQKDSEQKHNHPFPFHHHISEKADFVLVRTNITGSNPQNESSILFLVSEVFLNDFFEDPSLILKNYKGKSFIISSHYCPVANALRGPPYIV